MNAIEFVKKFGLDLAKRDVAAWQSGFIKREDFLENYGFDILDDLKQIVDAFELVERLISDHNKNFKECQIDLNGLKIMVKKHPKIYPKRFMQAINLVEQCNA